MQISEQTTLPIGKRQETPWEFKSINYQRRQRRTSLLLLMILHRMTNVTLICLVCKLASTQRS